MELEDECLHRPALKTVSNLLELEWAIVYEKAAVIVIDGVIDCEDSLLEMSEGQILRGKNGNSRLYFFSDNDLPCGIRMLNGCGLQNLRIEADIFTVKAISYSLIQVCEAERAFFRDVNISANVFSSQVETDFSLICVSGYLILTKTELEGSVNLSLNGKYFNEAVVLEGNSVEISVKGDLYITCTDIGISDCSVRLEPRSYLKIKAGGTALRRSRLKILPLAEAKVFAWSRLMQSSQLDMKGGKALFYACRTVHALVKETSIFAEGTAELAFYLPKSEFFTFISSTFKLCAHAALRIYDLWGGKKLKIEDCRFERSPTAVMELWFSSKRLEVKNTYLPAEFKVRALRGCRYIKHKLAYFWQRLFA